MTEYIEVRVPVGADLTQCSGCEWSAESAGEYCRLFKMQLKLVVAPRGSKKSYDRCWKCMDNEMNQTEDGRWQ